MGSSRHRRRMVTGLVTVAIFLSLALGISVAWAAVAQNSQGSGDATVVSSTDSTVSSTDPTEPPTTDTTAPPTDTTDTTVPTTDTTVPSTDTTDTTDTTVPTTDTTVPPGEDDGSGGDDIEVPPAIELDGGWFTLRIENALITLTVHNNDGTDTVTEIPVDNTTNHGGYVSALAKAADKAKGHGHIVSLLARSDVGKKCTTTDTTGPPTDTTDTTTAPPTTTTTNTTAPPTTTTTSTANVTVARRGGTAARGSAVTTVVHGNGNTVVHANGGGQAQAGGSASGNGGGNGNGNSAGHGNSGGGNGNSAGHANGGGNGH